MDISPERFTQKMRGIHPDAEDAIEQAEELMVELLEALGYEHGVAAFRRLAESVHSSAQDEDF